MKKYAVIGVGVSGASCAYQLNQKGYNVELFDKGRRFGGRTSSKQVQEYLFNFGSSLLLDSTEASTLVQHFPILSPILSQEYQHNTYKEMMSLDRLEDPPNEFAKTMYPLEGFMNQLCYQLIHKIPSTSSHHSFRVLGIKKE